MTGSATPVVETIVYVLTYTAPISIISFIITLMLCMPTVRDPVVSDKAHAGSVARRFCGALRSHAAAL